MARVTVRFFKINKGNNQSPSFEEALQEVFSSAPMASDREKFVSDQTYRLERLTQNVKFYDGEVVRKQVGDIPPEANDAGLQKLSLSEGGGIGHCIAFRYSAGLSCIAIQFDNRAVSINRLLAYILQFDPTFIFTAVPIVREDAWEKYNRGVPTKYEIEIAQPQNLARVEGEVGSVISSATTLAEISGVPIITIEAKMGRAKGSLIKEAVDSIIKYFTVGEGGKEDVRKLKVSAADDIGSEEINFITDFLRETKDVTVPEGESNGHYAKRAMCSQKLPRTTD